MTTLITKSTLYDTLSMIIPGYLILLWLKMALFPLAQYSLDIVSQGIIVFVISYLIGIALHIFTKHVFNPILRNKKSHIQKAYDKVGKRILLEETDDIREIYYIAYYRVLTQYLYTTIPIIEAKVSFIRSMICVLILYLFIPYFIDNTFQLPCSICYWRLVIVLMLVILLKIVFVLQNEIYTRVWEDDYYIRTLSGKK